MRRIKKIIELFLGISFIYGYFCTEKRISKLVSNMEKTIILSAIVGILPQVTMAQSNEPTVFDVIVLNEGDDNIPKEIQHPHRSSDSVTGIYDAFTGSLCLGASFDIACVQIYKDGQLIVNESYPVMTGGEVYYNLSFYGSGAYRICLYDEDGNSYMAYLNV